jgi:hypothetical protein
MAALCHHQQHPNAGDSKKKQLVHVRGAPPVSHGSEPPLGTFLVAQLPGAIFWPESLCQLFWLTKISGSNCVRARSGSVRPAAAPGKSFVIRRKAHAAVILLSAPVILVSIRVALTGGSICVRLVVYKNNAGHKAKAHHNLYAHLCMWMQHLENHPEKCESQPTGFQLRRRHTHSGHARQQRNQADRWRSMRTATTFRPRTHARTQDGSKHATPVSKQILVCMPTDGQDRPTRCSCTVRELNGAAGNKTTTQRLSGGLKITAASARST